MVDRNVSVDVELNDKTGPGALSVERRLERLEGAGKRTSRKLSDSLRDGGHTGGRRFAASFVASAGPLVAKMPLGPHAAIAVGAAAPLIAATLGAAISAGAAAGAVGIGAAIVAQEPQVRAAAIGLGTTINRSMRTDARPMIAPVLAGLATLDRRAELLRPKFRQIFTDAARYAPVFTRAIDQSLQTLVDGFADITANAGPVVDVLGTQIPRTVAVVVGGMRQLAAESGNSAAALSTVFTAVQGIFAVTAGSLTMLNKALPFTSGALLKVNDMITGSGEAAAGADPSLDQMIQNLIRQGSAGGAAAAGTAAATAATVSFTQAVTTAFSAETRLGEALDQVTDKQYRNSAGLSVNTEKGRQNRAALQNLASAGLAAAEAARHHGGGAQRAAQIMAQSYDAFIRAARGMGVSQQAARELAAALGLIKSKTVTIKTVFTTSGQRRSGGSTATGGTQVSGFDAPSWLTWSPASAAARAAFDSAASAFTALTPGSGSRVGGPMEVNSTVSVLLDGQPFRDFAARATDEAQRRAAWRTRVGRRDR